MFQSAIGITEYHAHVYFDTDTKDYAQDLYDELKHFGEIGAMHEKSVGPHSAPQFRLTFTPYMFRVVVPWLMLNRDGLSVLIHPISGQDVLDHLEYAFWLGSPKTLFLSRL